MRLQVNLMTAMSSLCAEIRPVIAISSAWLEFVDVRSAMLRPWLDYTSRHVDWPPCSIIRMVMMFQTRYVWRPVFSNREEICRKVSGTLKVFTSFNWNGWEIAESILLVIYTVEGSFLFFLPDHSSCTGLLLHLVTHSDTLTIGRTPLDEWSGRCRGFYLQ